MISEKFRVVFVHIPRTGGQSIERVFLNKSGLTWATRAPLLLRRTMKPGLEPERLAHLYAREYYELGYLTRSTFESYFKFSIVRNPWERLVSEYRFNYQGLSISFDDFLFRLFPPEGLSDARRHVEPQCRFLFDRDGTCLVDKILRMDRLNDQAGDMFFSIFQENISLPWFNASYDRTDYRKIYSKKSIEFVDEFYKEDIEQFGFSFQ
jgi:hypothetical protein